MKIKKYFKHELSFNEGSKSYTDKISYRWPLGRWLYSTYKIYKDHDALRDASSNFVEYTKEPMNSWLNDVWYRFMCWCKYEMFGSFIPLHVNPYRMYNLVKDKFKKPVKSWCFGFGRRRMRFYVNYTNILFSYFSSDVSWKDKYNTPRYEFPPTKYISLFGGLIWFGYVLESPYKAEDKCSDDYWEQLIWTAIWANGDVDEARQTWPWTTISSLPDKEESTWDEKYLKK